MVDPSVSAVSFPAIRSDVPPPRAYTRAQSAGARKIPGREDRNRANTYPGSASMGEEFSRTFDQTSLSAWQEQTAVARNPSVKQWCLQQEPKLQPRFAEHYQQLRALRRRVRGVLNANGGALGQGLRCSWHSARRRYLPRHDQRRRDVYPGQSHCAANNDTNATGYSQEGQRPGHHCWQKPARRH
jgi:hypothetical protein